MLLNPMYCALGSVYHTDVPTLSLKRPIVLRFRLNDEPRHDNGSGYQGREDEKSSAVEAAEFGGLFRVISKLYARSCRLQNYDGDIDS